MRRTQKPFCLVLILLLCCLLLTACAAENAPSADAPHSAGSSYSASESAPAEAPSGSDHQGAEPVPGGFIGEVIYPEDQYFPEPKPQSGILTAGEWKDADHWTFFKDVINGNSEWREFQKSWRFYPSNRIPVTVTDGQTPVEGAYVTLRDENDNILWQAVTDNRGQASLFYDLFGSNDARPAYVIAEKGFVSEQSELQSDALISGVEIGLQGAESRAKALDLMLVFDTTGSMDDELTYLQSELESVIGAVKRNNGDLPIRVSVNFYRDTGDLYTVRDYPFTADVAEAARILGEQEANGGGDYEEAVEKALANAVYEHEWSVSASAKLMLLILDAPPHNKAGIREDLQKTIRAAAAEGIRIIPIAASGVDTETEFLLRTFAAATGGTYLFLTDDSGVGNEHLEPTIGSYQVELLNKLLIRVIGEYLQ